MSLYTDSIALSPGPGAFWTLSAPLSWEIGFKGSGLVWTVPAGYVTDLASIPVLARMLFDRGDARLAKAAILHDHMLDSGVDRITAAAEFHSALRADGVARWRRLVMFLAVALWRYD
ncbi:MAG: DUF1353 domain-containing protein [Mesorhizobium sp.]